MIDIALGVALGLGIVIGAMALFVLTLWAIVMIFDL
jgi:hypothetical protein